MSKENTLKEKRETLMELKRSLQHKDVQHDSYWHKASITTLGLELYSSGMLSYYAINPAEQYLLTYAVTTFGIPLLYVTSFMLDQVYQQRKQQKSIKLLEEEVEILNNLFIIDHKDRVTEIMQDEYSDVYHHNSSKSDVTLINCLSKKKQPKIYAKKTK